ncbi:MAG: 50S ribosomal protein L15 [Candidatus Omnitrophica bacterium]|nr:50S ribosomal protein L15 [Candidatus Omnitrophota bacterium]MCA9433058.1 50S ribosomal protein L15 [Candidatus Omnitrophota bacterium]MCA9435644.1 50S ribosomal protein L15 [Candidatus Omnitrophota bacterium]MCA9440638.1 50S ribosomal protein L15 [Candidatus Omnitrophota bacterium]MCA9449747.1 50S ribosomal protein L15 [Candidatus Omnitrophota bacterium]
MSTFNLPSPSGGKKSRKRVGRGRGTGLGKTSGRGMNGQNSRAGGKRPAWFEGGQMPLIRRIPKRGFTPISRTEYQVVNLSDLSKFEAGSSVTPVELGEKGLVKDPNGLVKILGNGELSQAVNVCAHGFSASAKEKIEKAGGSVTVVEKKPSATETKNES